ncbi:hypothetical protein [Actinacidiphila glaucinigra]|uniref:hypothetical protein n=1 Tax=Actinacidiphila glaucinigra TaxID=235986 RepID=UPI003D8E0748
MPERNAFLEAEAIAYRLLMLSETVSVDRVATEAGITAQAAEDVLTSLTEKGLAGRVGDDYTQFSASLQPAGETLSRLQRQAEALDRARTTVDALLATYRRAVDDSTDRLVEVLIGTDMINQRLVRMQQETLHEMIWLCKSQDFFTGRRRSTSKVHHRVLFDKNSLPGDAPSTTRPHPSPRNALFRLLPQVPLDLAISDHNVGLWLLTHKDPGDGSSEPAAVMVRDDGTLEALRLLFESQWEISLLLSIQKSGNGSPVDAPPTHLDKVDLKILSLLIEGTTEKAAARYLGMSLRTLQRRIGRLMTLAGASNRMQLAWYAARRGWLR